MKKFITCSTIYVLPVLAAAILLEMLLRQIPNDYSYKKNYLDTHACNIGTLIFGSSHSYYGIDPVYFSTNDVFNAAHISQSLDYDYEILKQYDEKLNHLKTVVIPVSYSTLWSKLSTGQEAWRVKNYLIYYKISKESDKIKYHFELLGNRRLANIKHILRYLQGNSITCSQTGWGTNYHSQNAQDLVKTGKTASERHTVKDIHALQRTEIFNDNISVLDSIISLCRRHHANVLLFTPPAYKTYCQHLDREQLTIMIEKSAEIANKYPNCTYINLMTDTSFVASDYYDADHLSEIGARKLSKIIDKYIHKLNDNTSFQ